MNPKRLSSSKINPAKLLGGSSFVKNITNTTNISEKLKEDSITISRSDLTTIKGQVFQIKNLVTSLTTLKKKSTTTERKETEREKFGQREKELEKKKKPEDNKIKLPQAPKLGFLDIVKRFVVNTLIGFVVVRLIKHLPKLIEVAKFVGGAMDFITNVGGKLLNGLATFVQKGYEAYDFTKNTLKSFGGDKALKLFDGFNDAIGNTITAAIAASFALADMVGSDGGGGIGDLVGTGIKGVKGAQGASATTQAAGVGTAGAASIVAGAGLLASALGEGAFQLKKFGNKQVEESKKSYDSEKNWIMKPVRWVGYQQARFANFTLGTIGVLLDIVGAPFRYAIELIRYSFLSDEDKIKQAKNLAKFDARIREQFREGLNALSFGLLFKEKGSFGNIYGDKGAQKEMMSKMAGGGKTPVTRGGRLISGPRRTITKSKAKRQISIQPTQLKPGANIGGEEKIEKVFPKSTDKNQVSPLDYIEKSYKNTNQDRFFGSLLNLQTKSLVGQKPSKVDYANAAQGLSNWMTMTFSDEILRTGAVYAAGGGEINADMLSKKSGDMTDAIAKSLEDSISKRLDANIDDLMKQMMLKQPTREPDKSDPTIPEDELIPGGLTEGQWGPLLDLIASKESGRNYEAMYPSTTLPGATKMTIAEVARRATGAVGKYQQLPQYLIGRAKAAGLNPDKDLYSPENQEKIIINVNIKGRGGEKWLRNEISDEQFMQGLSQEFASLPNAQGKFYYHGQRSAMTPEKIKAALSKVKKGGYSQQELAESKQNMITGGKFNVIEYITGDKNHPNFELRGHGLPGNYHDHIAFSTMEEKEKAKRALRAAGIQIGSELRPGDPGYHGRNLAIDIPGSQWGGSGAIGTKEFDGSRKVRSVLGIGNAAPRFHGGFIPKDSKYFLHKGEFVVDADSVNLVGKNFIATINSIENSSQLKQKVGSLINHLSYITGYEPGGQQEIIVEIPDQAPEVVTMPVPVGGGGIVMMGSGSGEDYSQELYSHS